MRVGLTQRVSVIEEYSERRDCLDQAWTTLLEELDHVPIPLPNQVDSPTEYLSSRELDAIVLTSGNDLVSVPNPSNPAPERDRFEKAVLDYAIDVNIPVLGVCRGLELINSYFGGKLAAVTDHVATTHDVDFTDADVGIPPTGTVSVNSYHDYGVHRSNLGNNLVVVGTAPDGTVECFVHETHPIWGIMWHPERNPSSLDRQILNSVVHEEKR
jgi:putative glutamine amidotransferase